MPRAVAALAVLLAAGFVAASIGTAKIGRSSATTTTATTSTTTTTSTTPSEGCPPGPSGATVSVNDVHPPARLQVASFTTTPPAIAGNFTTFTALAKITTTCGQPVQGAIVYVTAVPYQQVHIEEGMTGSDGTVTLTFTRARHFPASSRQGLLVFFVRAARTGDPLLAGISTRRLVSVRVHL